MKELGRADYGTKRKRRRREIFIEASQINENDLSECRHVGIRSSRNRRYERRTKKHSAATRLCLLFIPSRRGFFLFAVSVCGSHLCTYRQAQGFLHIILHLTP